MNTIDIDLTALRLTEMAAVSVRALEERKPGCAEKNNIGLAGAIRHALLAERERWEAEIERLRVALKPFADAAMDADGYSDNHPLGCDPQMELAIKIEDGAFAPLKVSHLRTAARALQQH